MYAWLSFLEPHTRLTVMTVAVGAAAAVTCALLGCFLLLRRMSLIGDAIAHAVLPGLAIAFLLTGRLSLGPMLLGGMAAGMLTAFLTHALHKAGDVPEDSALGIAYTSLFALGVLLISQIRGVHIDTDCVLFGELVHTPLQRVKPFGIDLPRALVSLGVVLAASIAFLMLFWKELKIVAFDPALAAAMGLSVGVVHYQLMGLVAAATVASLEAVGAVLVVAMLIVPAATAHLLTDRLVSMVACSAAVALVAAVAGVLLANRLDTSAAGMITVALGVAFTSAVIFAPRRGVVAGWINRFRLALRILVEDVVAFLYRREEASASEPAPTAAHVASRVGQGWLVPFVVGHLRRSGVVTRADSGGLLLTDAGRERGQALVRSHRLWETYLDEHFDLPPDHLHDPAHELEHFIGPELRERIASELASPETDPHGRDIPQPHSDPPPES